VSDILKSLFRAKPRTQSAITDISPLLMGRRLAVWMRDYSQWPDLIIWMTFCKITLCKTCMHGVEQQAT